MPHDVTMPQLGMAQDAGKIVSWLKAPGDLVAKGDALFEVETDKAVMEVEAAVGGYLVGVTAAEGDDVPVGQVIARISDSPDNPVAEPAVATTDKATSSEAEAAGKQDLPEGRSVTMPQLGMAQDSGLIVSWLKTPGDKLVADDVLFEVETDKSTMEVPAGFDGYLAATLAEPGEEVPVGRPVAIISAEKPANPVARQAADPGGAAAMAPAPAPAPAPASDTPKNDKTAPAPKTAAAPNATGRILASPKARRLALERGLDLQRLVDEGHPQPFHVADLAVLESLPATATNTGAQHQTTALHLTAAIAVDGVPDFVAWADSAHGIGDADAIIAGLAGACLPGARTVRISVERLWGTRMFDVPAGRALSRVSPADDGEPDLVLRDLRGTALRQAQLGVEGAPVLTVVTADAGLVLSLDCTPDQLAPRDALHLLSEFSSRMEQPLRHLL
jgi:pyruvate dehydrogenase E2 component (dihydrolipoamide acetyltransferase)/2-oxoglutarate dehydrogenase E2 component (dihydrolipoamide succinyltransferase)